MIPLYLAPIGDLDTFRDLGIDILCRVCLASGFLSGSSLESDIEAFGSLLYFQRCSIIVHNSHRLRRETLKQFLIRRLHGLLTVLGTGVYRPLSMF